MFQKKENVEGDICFSLTKNNQQSELEMIWRSQAGHQRIALRPLVTLLPFPMLSCLHTGKGGVAVTGALKILALPRLA